MVFSRFHRFTDRFLSVLKTDQFSVFQSLACNSEFADGSVSTSTTVCSLCSFFSSKWRCCASSFVELVLCSAGDGGYWGDPSNSGLWKLLFDKCCPGQQMISFLEFATLLNFMNILSEKAGPFSFCDVDVSRIQFTLGNCQSSYPSYP
jgi:hypothetical protein